MNSELRIAVIGLGYVGLPLAVCLARKFHVVGLDVDTSRVAEIHDGHDRTGEVDDAVLRSSTLETVSDSSAVAEFDVYIITVPTPIDADNKPDLKYLSAASKMIGQAMKAGATVVYESTVYPGVTEDYCGPILEKESGLTCGRDFFLGYSPERINPGDREHTLERVTKVVAGQTPEVAERLREIYGTVNDDNIFIARDIKTAEAAKVIENAQRDINIAFINEVAVICSRLGLSTQDVLTAARTKWNFLNFQPGLVGGHCIGVDPYYLAHCARGLGHEPDVILSGRRINEEMGGLVADTILSTFHGTNPGQARARILVLGLTFKENVPDLRNTKVVDVIERLSSASSNGGAEVDVHDPLASRAEAKSIHGIDLHASLDGLGPYDCLVGAVPHREYCEFGATSFARLVRPGGLVADIKGMWRQADLPEGIRYWSL
jgi:UDP-N-acetyl-D-glucosamine/UDP-N-acetyl-D-galactosamine dehydrogenase